MTLEELRIVISASTEPLRREMGQVRRQLGELQNETNRTTSGMQGAFKKLVAGVIALKIGQKIGQAITSGIREAMNVEASLQQIKRIMGESTNQFLKWANTQAIAFNMSKGEAIKYGSVFGNLLMTFTKSSSETMKYTEDLLKASSVIASATGRSMTDVMERIRSGLLGNTEAIEDLGVNVNVAMIQSTEAFKKFANGKSWNQLSFQTQQQIRLMAILEQTSKKYGDTVNQNTSSQLQQLVANLNNVKLSLGQAFLPIVRIVLPVLTALAQQLSYVMGIVAQFSEALFGKSMQTGNKQAQNAQEQAKAMTNLGNATEKAGKQAKGALAGFDEINNLSDNSGGSDNGAIDAPTIDNSSLLAPNKDDSGILQISKEVQDVADKVKGVLSEIGSDINDFVSKVAKIFLVIRPTLQPIIDAKEPILIAFSEIGQTALLFKDTVLKPIADYVLLDFIPFIVIGFTESFAPVFADVAIWAVEEFAKTFENVTKVSSDLWNNTWLPNIERIKIAYLESMPLIAKSVQDLLDGTIKPFVDYVLNQFIMPISAEIVDTLVPIFTDIAVAAFKQFADSFIWAVNMVNDIWNNVLKPVFNLIKDIVLDTLEIVKKLWDEYGATLLKNIRDFINGVQETVQLLWDNVLKPIIQPFLEMLSWLWDKHLKGLVEQIGEFIMKCINGALELYNGFIKPIIDWMIVELGPNIANTVSYVVDTFGSMLAGIADIIKGLFKVLGGIIDFIVGTFTGNWSKAWNGVKDIFKGVFESLIGIVKIPLNYIIDAINTVVRGLNSISIDIPEWVPGFGGKKFGISIPTIPKLARGGIVDSPTIAQIGEAGKEMVVPLENTSFVDKLASALGTAVMAAMQFSASKNSSNNQGDAIMQLDGTTFARLIRPYIQSELARLGVSVITTT